MTASHLLRLPVELHLSITDKLELHDCHNLATTNHYFRSIIKPPTHKDYLVAEAGAWAQQKCLLACSGCVRFRRFKEFTDDMRKGKCTRGGLNAGARLCIRCGVAAGLYLPGTMVVINGERHVVRRMCGTSTDQPTCQAPCRKCSP
ncbi:hypothetical protein CC86DRAFT_274906, partial [Ophiobolus disseminans]